ncbi:hypothetical protein [Rufibacter roseus]|uniref:Uncharacterized protein n=1 Tax=Rufibacter roseus TaxID=1567108 RepID=A0ABW2DPF7_9BACT|nr:hypothetical protein [Rufibacter roseus]
MAIKDKDNHAADSRPQSLNDETHQRNAPGNHPDPTAKRNIGLNGETERNDQKDKLENLHIGGNEITGYGANDHTEKESFAQGPGFEYEGSYQEMDGSVNGVRSTDQPLGSDDTEPSDNEYKRI